ncbi:MAG: zinc ribbon domain-containing protein [Methanomassiliicoccales archaeon]
MILLLLGRCDCGAVSLPPEKRCHVCGKNTMEQMDDGRGRVIAVTCLFSPQEGMEEGIMLCLVALDAGAQVVCRAMGKVARGDEVTVRESGTFYICDSSV